ncbi:MAG TPA: PPOX class F420-dependent oxidoreductase [Egibacteraceae bacterium]|jgi:PPOX class probable F420-dependent enzyme|nr:PPOX class F420-dependent oxidoreductase [Egibacteraceae bacterium]
MPVLTPDDARAFLAEHRRGVLATMKSSDGRPQLSNVSYAVVDGLIGVSVTAGRAKVANVHRDPRVSLHVTSVDFWTYVVAEGDAELSPVSTDPGDATGRMLLRVYESAAGKPHPDPEEFFQAMVDDRRLLLSFTPTYLYPTTG